jgi:membrane protein required for colicin V production
VLAAAINSGDYTIMTVALNALDYTLIAVILISSLIGFMLGFVRESLSLVFILLGLWLAFEYSSRLQYAFVDLIPNAEARLWAAVISIILVTILVGAGMQKLILHFMKKTESTYLDKFVGLIFGVLRGGVLVGLIVWGISNTAVKDKSLWADSGMVKYMQKSLAWLDQHHDAYASVADTASEQTDDVKADADSSQQS